MYYQDNDFNTVVWVDSSKKLLDKLALLNKVLKEKKLKPIFITRTNKVSNLLKKKNIRSMSIIKFSIYIFRSLVLEDFFYLKKIRTNEIKNQIYWDNLQSNLLKIRRNFSFRHFYNFLFDFFLKKIFFTSISLSINKGYLKNALILNGLNSFGYLLTKICHKRNISCIFWENGLYEGTLFINSYGVNAYGKRNISFFNKDNNRKRKVDEFISEFITSERKYILCPLQFEIDTNIVCASQFNDCNQFLKKIIFPLSLILKDHNFLIRPHPKQKKVNKDIKSFIENNKNLELDNSINVENSLCKCDIVICINSTVGFTAFSNGLPVISFGRSFWNDLNSRYILDISKKNFEFFYNDLKLIQSNHIISEIQKKSFGFNNIDPNIINFNKVSFMQSKPSRFFPEKVY